MKGPGERLRRLADAAVIVVVVLAFWAAVIGLTAVLLRDLSIVVGRSLSMWQATGVAGLLWFGALCYLGRHEIRKTVKEEVALWRKRRGK